MMHSSTTCRTGSIRGFALLVALLATTGCDDPTSVRQAGAPASIAIVSGDEQTGSVGAPLGSELAVVVRDSSGLGVASEPVVFWYTDFDNHANDVGTVLTDADGVGRFIWQPTGLAGLRVVNASVASARDRIRALFVIQIDPGPASRVEVLDPMQDAYAGAPMRAVEATLPGAPRNTGPEDPKT